MNIVQKKQYHKRCSTDILILLKIQLHFLDLTLHLFGHFMKGIIK